MSEKLTKTLSATEARNNFFELLESLKTLSSYITITHRGKPIAIMMNPDEFESWQETVELSCDPILVKNIKESVRDLEKGRYLTLDEVFPEFEKRMTIADKANIEYKIKQIVKDQKKHVSNNHTSKGKKRTKKNS